VCAELLWAVVTRDRAGAKAPYMDAPYLPSASALL